MKKCGKRNEGGATGGQVGRRRGSLMGAGRSAGRDRESKGDKGMRRERQTLLF